MLHAMGRPFRHGSANTASTSSSRRTPTPRYVTHITLLASRRKPREDDPEAAPLVDLALELESSSVGLDGPLRDREPETGPAELAGARRVHAIEAVEDALSVLLRDPGPVVLDLEHRGAVACFDDDPDRLAARAVLDRVVDEVDD